MPQSLAKIWIHIIYSTKNRFGFLHDNTIRDQMHAYLASIHQEYESPALIVGGVADHVHILCTLSKNHTVTKLIGEAKRNSSKWAKKQDDVECTKFKWQTGYGAFSVSESKVDSARKYIDNQEEHHRTISFQDEFRQFLHKYKIEYDERYVWD